MDDKKIPQRPKEIVEFAALASVDPRIVRRVYAGTSRGSRGCLERIELAAATLGYEPPPGGKAETSSRALQALLLRGRAT